MAQFRAAIIGAGNMGSEWARALTLHPDFEIVGISTRTRSRGLLLQKAFGVRHLAAGIVDLYKSLKPDVVFIAVPELELHSVLLEAFQFPWIRVIEKPIGIDLESARSLSKESSSAEGKSFVALNRRFYSSTQKLKFDLSQTPGRRHILMMDQHTPLEALRGGRPRQVAQNWMFANAIHTVDLLRHLGRGTPEIVSKHINFFGRQAFFLTANLNFESGDSGTYCSVWNAPGRWALQVFTGDSHWELKPLEHLKILHDASKPYEDFSPVPQDVELKPGLWGMLSELSCEFTSGASELPSLAEGLESVELVSTIYDQIEVI